MNKLLLISVISLPLFLSACATTNVYPGEKEGRVYESQNTRVCESLIFECSDNEAYFNDYTGCGCEAIKKAPEVLSEEEIIDDIDIIIENPELDEGIEEDSEVSVEDVDDNQTEELVEDINEDYVSEPIDDPVVDKVVDLEITEENAEESPEDSEEAVENPVKEVVETSVEDTESTDSTEDSVNEDFVDDSEE